MSNGRFKKGKSGCPEGRPKGVPNKTTRDVRQAVATIARWGAPLVKGWLTRTAKEDPARAAELYLKLIEYHIPKLARTEVTGEGGGPLDVSATVIEIPANGRSAS